MPRLTMLAAAGLLMMATGCGEDDPAQGFLNVQRILISQEINLPRDNIRTHWESGDAEIVSPGRAHVSSSYSTPIGGPIPYQMIVTHNPSNGTYQSVCFTTEPEGGCF